MVDSPYGAENTVGEQKPSVHSVYKELLDKGYKAKDAAKEAQARTGLSLVTGKRFKDKTSQPGYTKKYDTKGLKYKGQYG